MEEQLQALQAEVEALGEEVERLARLVVSTSSLLMTWIATDPGFNDRMEVAS